MGVWAASGGSSTMERAPSGRNKRPEWLMRQSFIYFIPEGSSPRQRSKREWGETGPWGASSSFRQQVKKAGGSPVCSPLATLLPFLSRESTEHA